jgi:hypothetical protein
MFPKDFENSIRAYCSAQSITEESKANVVTEEVNIYKYTRISTIINIFAFRTLHL